MVFRQPFDAQQDAVKDGVEHRAVGGDTPTTARRINTAAIYTRIVPIVREGCVMPNQIPTSTDLQQSQGMPVSDDCHSGTQR